MPTEPTATWTMAPTITIRYRVDRGEFDGMTGVVSLEEREWKPILSGRQTELSFRTPDNQTFTLVLEDGVQVVDELKRTIREAAKQMAAGVDFGERLHQAIDDFTSGAQIPSPGRRPDYKRKIMFVESREPVPERAQRFITARAKQLGWTAQFRVLPPPG